MNEKKSTKTMGKMRKQINQRWYLIFIPIVAGIYYGLLILPPPLVVTLALLLLGILLFCVYIVIKGKMPFGEDATIVRRGEKKNNVKHQSL